MQFVEFMNAFSAVLEPTTLVAILSGVLIGQLVGILPGISSPAAIALLLPATYALGPVPGLAMLCGIWLGSSYGGIITSVLLNIPGEGDSVIATLDGHQLAKQGRSALALGVSALGGFAAASIALFLLQVLGPSIAGNALRFGPPQIFALMMFGLAIVAWLGGKSILKNMVSVATGLLIGTVGTDIVSGEARLTFGSPELLQGIDFVAVVVGLFGLGEVLHTIGSKFRMGERARFSFRDLLPRPGEWRPSILSTLRGTTIGFLTGIVPGVGPTNATFIAYAVEKKVARDPDRFGKGAIEGVAAPGAAAHSATIAGLIPLLALGIPASATAAILVGGFVIHGLFPGPLLYSQRPDVVWGLIASLYVANALLLLINTLFIPVLVLGVRLAHSHLSAVIGVLTMIGAYSLNNSVFDMWMALAFGILGYLFRVLNIPIAPLVIALVLGSKAEKSLRQSLVMSDGHLDIFFSSPIAVTLFLLAALVLVGPVTGRLLRRLRHSPDPGLAGSQDSSR
ncbi:tripartite tricarboxylate transporter permease [Prosthecomicrobium sp. N25]|uniref:tripartite tricarboxylate transporter permease n=1 Tax=Prosthecomicrobium sp. N25 TaxID=3129254 RepID=UPI003076F31E